MLVRGAKEGEGSAHPMVQRAGRAGERPGVAGAGKLGGRQAGREARERAGKQAASQPASLLTAHSHRERGEQRCCGTTSRLHPSPGRRGGTGAAARSAISCFVLHQAPTAESWKVYLRNFKTFFASSWLRYETGSALQAK